MVLGRLFSAAANAALLGIKEYTFKVFITASFITSLPGIITQLIVIPILTKFISNYAKLNESRIEKIGRLRNSKRRA